MVVRVYKILHFDVKKMIQILLVEKQKKFTVTFPTKFPSSMVEVVRIKISSQEKLLPFLSVEEIKINNDFRHEIFILHGGKR